MVRDWKNVQYRKEELGMIYHHRNDEGSLDASISKKWGNAYKGKKIAKGYYTRVLHFSCVSNSLKMWNIIICCTLCLLSRRKNKYHISAKIISSVIINDYRIIEYLLFFLVGCSSFNSKEQVGHQTRIFIRNQMGNKKVKPS